MGKLDEEGDGEPVLSVRRGILCHVLFGLASHSNKPTQKGPSSAVHLCPVGRGLFQDSEHHVGVEAGRDSGAFLHKEKDGLMDAHSRCRLDLGRKLGGKMAPGYGGGSGGFPKNLLSIAGCLGGTLGYPSLCPYIAIASPPCD